LHPRTKKAIYESLNIDLIEAFFGHKNIKVTQPLGFLDMISLEKNTRLIITDSGGLQKEAYFFKKPCLVLRDNTEWIELVQNGNAMLGMVTFRKAGHTWLIEVLTSWFDSLTGLPPIQL
jgi:UDP-GlcNAc3NAcA epimerase